MNTLKGALSNFFVDLKVRSHLFGEFLWAKSSHFIGKPRNQKFHPRAKDLLIDLLFHLLKNMSLDLYGNDIEKESSSSYEWMTVSLVILNGVIVYGFIFSPLSQCLKHSWMTVHVLLSLKVPLGMTQHYTICLSKSPVVFNSHPCVGWKIWIRLCSYKEHDNSELIKMC